MKCIPFVVLLLAGCSTQPTKHLFRPVHDPKLSSTEAKTLDDIRSEVFTVNVTIVVMEPLSSDKFLIPLPEENIEITSYSKSGNAITWRANNDTEFGMLTFKDGICKGIFYSGKKVFVVQHLGGVFHVISQIDQTKFPKERKKK